MDEGVPLIETSCTCCRAQGISTFQSGIHTYNSGGVLTQWHGAHMYVRSLCIVSGGSWICSL